MKRKQIKGTFRRVVWSVLCLQKVAGLPCANCLKTRIRTRLDRSALLSESASGSRAQPPNVMQNKTKGLAQLVTV